MSTVNEKPQIDVGEEDIGRILKIARLMREMGSKISTDEVEKAVRLYRTAEALSDFGFFPIRKVLESVFVKKKEDMEKLDKAIRSVESGEDIEHEITVKPRKNTFKGKKVSSKVKSSRKKINEQELSWSELEKMSIGKLKRMRLDTDENIKRMILYRQVEMLSNYYRTGNSGYLELLKDKMTKASQKRKGNYESKEGASLGGRYREIEEAVYRLAYNPEDPSALRILSREIGENFAIDALRFLISRKKRAVAEHIASQLVGMAVGKGKKIKIKKSPHRRYRLNIRATAYYTARTQVPTLIYFGKKEDKGITLLVDKSDSMRKHYASAVSIVLSYFDRIKRIYLFDEDVKQISLKKWHSKRYLLEEVLKAGTSGYTNISMALRKIESTLKPGSHLVIVSDMEQTVADESYILAILRLRRKNVKVNIYTIDKHIDDLKSLLEPEVKVYQMGSSV
jgi:hypothetical protein